MRYLLIAALLVQAPKPLPTPKPAATVNAGKAEKLPFIIADNQPIFTISDGDEPAGPGCDLGKLVRAVKSHFALEHPPFPSNALCLNKATQNWGTCSGDPAQPKLSDDFQSWEVCGDEGDGGWGTFTYNPALQRFNDPKTLRDMADCIERRTEKRKRAEKWQDEQEDKRKKADDEFRAELSRCEPKKPGETK